MTAIMREGEAKSKKIKILYEDIIIIITNAPNSSLCIFYNHYNKRSTRQPNVQEQLARSCRTACDIPLKIIYIIIRETG